MSEGMIIRRGGGASLKATDALLRVQAPAGSTVTITKGTTTKTDLGHENADDHSVYDYYFIIHQSQFDSVNAWTVTATDGVDTATDTVIIDAADEYDIALSYRLYLYKAGDQSGWTAKDWSCANGAGAKTPTISYANDVLQLGMAQYHSGVVYHTAKVDLTEYSTVIAHGNFSYNRSERWNGSGIYIMSALTGSYYPTSSATSAKTELPLGTFTDYDLTVDVSSLSGEYYVVIGLVLTSNYTIDGVYATK